MSSSLNIFEIIPDKHEFELFERITIKYIIHPPKSPFSAIEIYPIIPKFVAIYGVRANIPAENIKIDASSNKLILQNIEEEDFIEIEVDGIVYDVGEELFSPAMRSDGETMGMGGRLLRSSGNIQDVEELRGIELIVEYPGALSEGINNAIIEIINHREYVIRNMVIRNVFPPNIIENVNFLGATTPIGISPNHDVIILNEIPPGRSLRVHIPYRFRRTLVDFLTSNMIPITPSVTALISGGGILRGQPFLREKPVIIIQDLFPEIGIELRIDGKNISEIKNISAGTKHVLTMKIIKRGLNLINIKIKDFLPNTFAVEKVEGAGTYYPPTREKRYHWILLDRLVNEETLFTIEFRAPRVADEYVFEPVIEAGEMRLAELEPMTIRVRKSFVETIKRVLEKILPGALVGILTRFKDLLTR